MSRKDLAALGAFISTGMREPPQDWKRMEQVMGTAAAPSQPPRGCVSHRAGPAEPCLWSLRGCCGLQSCVQVTCSDVQCCKHQPSGPQSCRDQRRWVVPLGFLFSSSVFSQSPEIFVVFFLIKTVIPGCGRAPEAGFLRVPTVFQV